MKEQGTVTNLTVRRRRFAAISFTLGIAIAASGVFLSPAQARPSHRSSAVATTRTCMDNQRGITAPMGRDRHLPGRTQS